MHTSSWRELALVLAGFAALAVLSTYPLALHPGRLAYEIGVNFDAQFSVWNVAWVARTLVVRPLHVFDANIFFPHRWTLAYSEANLGAGALAAPVYWATRNPYAAHNSVVLLTFILSGTGAYYLARHVALDRRAAAIAAIGFAFCPHVFGHLPHIQLLMTAGLPFSLLAFHRLSDRPDMRRGAALGAVMAAQAYFCAYYAVFAMVLVGYAVVFTALARGAWRKAAFLKAVAIAALVAILCTAPLVVIYAMVQRQTGFARSVEDAASFSANWSAYFASSAYAHSWMLAYLPRWNEVLFPGFVAVIFGVVGLVAGVSARGRSRELTALYGSVALLAGWESFGPAAGLYRVTYWLVPGFSFLRAPSRFGIIVMLSFSVLAAMGIARLLARVRAATFVAALLALATTGELLTPLRLQAAPGVEAVYGHLGNLPYGAVLELPVYSDQFAYIRTRYMLGSTAHWMPLVDAYSDYIPKDFLDNTETLSNFPDQASIALLRQIGVRYALIHTRDYKGEMRTTLDRALRQLVDDVEPLYADGDAALFEITAAR